MISPDATVAAIVAYAPGIIAKATALLAACVCVAAVVGRASAAKQHLLWLCALVACAALVVLAPISKRIVVPVPSFIPASLSSATTIAIENHDSNRARDHASPSPPRRVAVGRQAESRISAPSHTAQWRPSRVATVGVIGWLLGFLFVTLRFVFACGVVNATVRRSRALTGLEWRTLLARVTDRRDITVRLGDELWSPFTTGLIRPTIVLPADVDEWNDERRDAVLRHEIAHIERGDVAAQTFGLLVCALFWFQPLAWFALARLRHESERAADDRVIGAGVSSIAYAAHLVELARGVGNGPSVRAVAVAMATPPLEQRVRAILDRKRSRGAVAARTRIAGMCTALASMLPISGAQFAHTVRPTVSASAPQADSRSPTASVSMARKVTAPPITLQNAQSRSARQDTVGVAAAAVAAADSLPSEIGTPARPGRIGLHPDFSGVWSWAEERLAGGQTSAVPPMLTITQTPTTITETVQRRATDEFGRGKCRLDATLQLEDGAPARAEFALNGIPGRSTYFAMSWDSDTLMVRTAQMGRGSISGAVERFWLTSDGRGLVMHSAPFGYAVNQERTDTIWRKK